MTRSLLLGLIAIGCSSTQSDGTVSTGVSCDVKDDERGCCHGDEVVRPSCVAGEWHCPLAFPNYWPLAECMAPSPPDTGATDAPCAEGSAPSDCASGACGDACTVAGDAAKDG